MQIIQMLLVTTLMAGPFCQKIVIDNSTLTSLCTTGARSTVDTFHITGTIGDNITKAIDQNWHTFVVIKVLRRISPHIETICQLLMDTGTCQPASTNTFFRYGCFYNTTTDQARFTVSGTVQADNSKAILTMQWQHQNGTWIYSNKNYSFPEIYDVNAAHLNLTVAGGTGNLPSGSCSFSLTLNKSNDLELCCSNTAKPCYPQIAFNGAVVTSNTETCVTYPASQLATDGVTGNLVLSYSVCNLTDYRQGRNCTVTSIPATDAADTTTVSSSSSSNAPESPGPPDDNKYKVLLPAVIVPVVVVIIIGISAAMCCYKTKKGSKGQPEAQQSNIGLVVFLSVIVHILGIASGAGTVFYLEAKSKKSKGVSARGKMENSPQAEESEQQEQDE